MFDKYKALQRIPPQQFEFRANRYEIWKGGQMVDEGNEPFLIMCSVFGDQAAVTIDGAEDLDEIAVEQEYDMMITGSDRLQLLTIPERTINENMGINMFKMVTGPTRAPFDFNNDEAYCCNLFTIDGVIRKITFSFNNPEKLIEFYEDQHEVKYNLDFEFESEDHIRMQNKVRVSGPHGGAPRMIKVEPDINGGDGVTVSIYNMQGNHPLWQNNIQMAPKQMKIVRESDDRVELRGYGTDVFGNNFSDYGMTVIYNEEGNPKRCVLHMYDRDVDITYFENLNDII